MTGLFLRALGLKTYNAIQNYKTAGISAFKNYMVNKAAKRNSKIIRNVLQQLPLSTQLANAKTEEEIKNLIQQFIKNNQAFFKQNPKVYNEFCTMIQERIQNIRAQSAFIA